MTPKKFQKCPCMDESEPSPKCMGKIRKTECPKTRGTRYWITQVCYKVAAKL